MVGIVGLYVVAYILGMFFDDTITVIISVSAVALITLLVAGYQVQVVAITGSGTFSNTSDLMDSVAANMGVILAGWTMFFPVRYVLRSFLPGRD